MNQMGAQTAAHPMFGQISPEQNLNLMMQNLDLAWNQEQGRFQQLQLQQNMMLGAAWEQERMKHEQIQRQIMQARAVEEQMRQAQHAAAAQQLKAAQMANQVFVPVPMMFQPVDLSGFQEN